MTNLNGTNIASGIVPFTTEDTYPTHTDSFGKGGYRSVQTISDRDSIPELRKTCGMLVYVQEDCTEYRLKSDNTWEDVGQIILPATQNALNNKVDVDGTKKLTDENFSLEEKNKLATIESGAQANPDLSIYAKTSDVNSALALKADKTEIGSSIQIVRL